MQSRLAVLAPTGSGEREMLEQKAGKRKHSRGKVLLGCNHTQVDVTGIARAKQ
jgi:ABC-type hemin transport system ATPase subunit